ncbi:uncharacterized protein LOC129916576 [Episyrphus balteatus]|uniref:uncharacterized protein LOC129916576 n=1 Tax=Episyrphus balteatus TaxID=286459 RepID=UPI002485FDD7|nr:uncharacterized protein LOC129916576 [Episyrphus balteatus]XP_055852570.1 uncharacterized protein LOC129916576 [Episyrphus balteatus]XP_055852571.1 uncharacterized protein LOC129916576 [Episyrphus balteatus]XP_055852572.1 uncharacterized protein LOC129916576 [Episyrphus balteatus]
MLLPSGHMTNDAQQPPPSSSSSSSSLPQFENGLSKALVKQQPKHPHHQIHNIGTTGDALTSTTTTGEGPTIRKTGIVATTNNSASNWNEIGRHLDALQENLKDGWTVHAGKEGRLYYCNHITQTSGWIPPCDNWNQCVDLPYGWERAVDSKGRPYFINHLNKTSTYEAPDCVRWDENPPEPRVVVLQRSQNMGFGFVAGSERPVIVRFVTDGGPSMNKLQPGDQILAVNGEDVKEAPRDHVIQLVRVCESQVTLEVCQPANHHVPGRKSTLLSAGKRAKLRSRPSRVRFAESVCVNGAPLFPPSAFSLGDICVPPMANVLKVFLENGQTKSFKYDATTTVQDVVSSLYDKLYLSAGEHFSLVLEHVKSLKRNKLTLLDPEESLARIAARPGAHKLRCLFRVTFVPISAADLAQRDLNTLDYLYMQCCNDVTQERFAPELQPEVALRLAALHMHQHALANSVSPAKLTVKVVEREFGLERFVPSSLFEGMKRKELRRLISHFLKLNSQMTGSSTKTLTQLQAKIHYLDIISGLPSYGAKCFSTNQREGVERVLLVSPRFGLSQIAGMRNSVPQPISSIEDFTQVIVNREDDVTCAVGVFMVGDRVAKFSMEDRDACEFSLVLAGYFRLLTGKDLPVDREREKYDEDNAPSYLAQHTVLPSTWSYLSPFHNRAHSINFLLPPPYHSVKQLTISSNDSTSSSNAVNSTIPSISNPMRSGDSLAGNKVDVAGGNGNQCDRNMNTTMLANNNHKTNGGRPGGHPVPHTLDLDIHSVMAMELHEDGKDSGLSDSSGGGSSSAMYCPASKGLIEARNEEVLRRVAEMQKMVENSEQYLNEHGEFIDEEFENDAKGGYIGSIQTRRNGSTAYSPNLSVGGGVIEFVDSDCDSLNSSKLSSNEDAPPPGALKHSDSLVLLAESINQDLSGITKGLNSISSSNNQGLDSGVVSQSETTPKPSRKMNGLSQLLSDLQALGHDCSQSESDSESVHTPSTSPTHKRPPQTHQNKKNLYRTSFGLHSPDGTSVGTDAKDYNLKEYLKQLKEYSKVDSNNQDTDLAAKKLSEIYGFEIGEDTFIETDPDLIDLRAIPPPQTPDELDALSILNAAPRGFGDSSSSNRSEDGDGDLDKFLAKVVIAPPTQKATPAKELTPEEIMSFIIPPPPNLEEQQVEKQPKCIDQLDRDFEECLYSNSKDMSLENRTSNGTGRPMKTTATHVIEYATVERKGAFSCCAKSKKEETSSNAAASLEPNDSNPNTVLMLPPRRCTHSDSLNPPARPPKSAELQNRYSPKKQISFAPEVKQREVITQIDKSSYPPPVLPPRCGDDRSLSPVVSFPPKKPPLPPISSRPILRAPHPLPSPTRHIQNNDNLAAKLSGMGSTHFQHNPSALRSDFDSTFNTKQQTTTHQQNRFNGHYRSNSDCPPVCLKNPSPNNKPQLSLLCSPQMSRKFNHSPSPVDRLISKNGYIIDVEALLAKTDVAMAGLLVKLDQVAAQCTAAQAAGGGSSINEEKFQRAREELTEQTLCLVTASKLLVVAMSDMTLFTLPEHLTSSLTAIRRITELTQDMTRHTSSPLQTRNIVLKVHDVSSSFRELVQVQMGPLGAGQLALQAECLANVLATLLRSLRVFSP